ncbi:hypothetical protein AD998_11410 [bacterium 336/3]|nr:hypothetical protein AD998_11410 [bacterium 336/3]
MKDLKIYTQGFPDGTFRKQRYFFHIIENDIFIPNESIGRDSLGEPLFVEQMKWIQQFEKQGCEYGGCGQWTCRKGEILEKIIEKLRMVENFKGVYSQMGYRENQLAFVNQLFIGNEATIQKIAFKKSYYDDSEKLLNENITDFQIIEQSYSQETGILTITTNDIIAMKKWRFCVDLPNNSFTSNYI